MKVKHLLPFIILFASCSGNVKQVKLEENDPIVAEELKTAAEVATVMPDTNTYAVKVFAINENEPSEGFGFEISSPNPGAFQVRQLTIPAIQGKRPFMSMEDANATANLMLDKIRKGILPPSIATHELDSIGVIY
jgi:hypothetical protein